MPGLAFATTLSTTFTHPMSGVLGTKTSLLSILFQQWRQLVGFALLFRVLESVLFTPLAAIGGKLLLGRTVLDSARLRGWRHCRSVLAHDGNAIDIRHLRRAAF